MRVLLDFKVDIVNILFNGGDQIEPSNQKCNVVTTPLYEMPEVIVRTCSNLI